MDSKTQPIKSRNYESTITKRSRHHNQTKMFLEQKIEKQNQLFRDLLEEPIKWFHILKPETWKKAERQRADQLLNEFYKLYGVQQSFLTEISQNYKRRKIMNLMINRNKNEIQQKRRRLTIEEIKRPEIVISSIKKLFR